MERSLQFGVARKLLQSKKWYNSELRPLLQTYHPHTLQVCHFVPLSLLPYVRRPDGHIRTMEEIVRQTAADSPTGSSTGIEAVAHIALLKKRLSWLKHTGVGDVQFSLQIGDVVRHTELGHIGVVAARLPCCPEPDAWLIENLNSATDERLLHPWYLILVARHDGLPADFMRYGSQLTHVKLEKKMSIGFHRFLPTYFRGYDSEHGTYTPKPSACISFPAEFRSVLNEDVARRSEATSSSIDVEAAVEASL